MYVAETCFFLHKNVNTSVLSMYFRYEDISCIFVLTFRVTIYWSMEDRFLWHILRLKIATYPALPFPNDFEKKM